MDKLKQQIQRKLIASLLIDQCARSEHLIFRDAWCSQDRVIRFTTPFFKDYFLNENREKGKWKTGSYVMYEVNNHVDSLIVNCVLEIAQFSYANHVKKDQLLNALGLTIIKPLNEIVLKSWELRCINGDVNQLIKDFNCFIQKEIMYFEDELHEKLIENKTPLELHEGAAEYVLLNKYERNPKARAACIATYGCTCVVCGMNFEKMYGPEFKDIIEVHHIVPISEIGEDYIVDPVRDLVPVCPNCHTALHRKKDGVYTVEELRSLINMHHKI